MTLYLEMMEPHESFAEHWDEGTVKVYYLPTWKYDEENIPQVVNPALWRNVTVKHMGEDFIGGYTIVLKNYIIQHSL